MTRTPLTVEHTDDLLRVTLFACPECRQVGKLAVSNVGGSLKTWCTGPIKSSHRKTRMEQVAFVEDRAA